jgi:hypothetical protein
MIFCILASCRPVGGNRRPGGHAASIIRVEVYRLRNWFAYVNRLFTLTCCEEGRHVTQGLG